MLGVLGPWELSGGPGHILFVRMWLRCVECRAGTILFRHSVGADGGTARISLSFLLCCSGYGMVEMVRGVVRFFSASFNLLSVPLVVGCPVVGFFCYIFRFSLVDLWYFLAVSYFVGC